MEPLLLLDFGGVRVHTGSEADTLNCAVYALGVHYRPRHLLSHWENTPAVVWRPGAPGHEATHVVQQTGVVRRKLAITQPGDVYEQEADRVAVWRCKWKQAPAFSRSARTLDRPGLALRLPASSVVGSEAQSKPSATLAEASATVPSISSGAARRPVDPGVRAARRDPGPRPGDAAADRAQRDEPPARPAPASCAERPADVREPSAATKCIERAFVWGRVELDRLNLTWAVIRGAIERFLNSLGVGDLLNLGGVLDRALVNSSRRSCRLVAGFARAAGSRILEFIFEGALALGGGAAQRVLGIFRRIGATFSLIVNDPGALPAEPDQCSSRRLPPVWCQTS